LLGGLGLSFGATLVLISAAGGKPQGYKALIAFALQLALAITLMVLRPKWSSLS
jgi:hypothetical protein